ncbi:Glycoside hydrolase, 38 vacuolar alpha mannosidase, partial [Rhizopus stolonifer]
QKFYEKNFGKRTRVFWLPDSFGYSAQLPQVLRQSGCDYFFTQKLSWNNINKFPLSTFWWTGIDDTSILAHLTPAETYTASVTPSEVYKCAKNHHDIESSNQSLLVYGHGDGGGGPTPEMLERLERMKDDGLPSVKPGSATKFFEGLEKHSDRLQSYKGELYLEFHRGTYTTQALVKRGNRKGEVILRDLELLATAAKLLSNQTSAKYEYPFDDIERLWKLLCLNQFHDCLPGSAINLAYVDVHKFHRQVISESSLLRHMAQSVLISESKHHEDEGADQKGVIVFNTLPWTRNEVIVCPEKNTKWTNQQYKGEYEYLLVHDIPGLGVSGYIESTDDLKSVSLEKSAQAYKSKKGHFILENMNLKAVFNANGQLVELLDKNSDRGNLVPENTKGNVLQLYEDVPTYWDAWDVEIYHLQKYVELEGQRTLEILSEGPVKAELCFEHKISDVSSIKQIISLTCIGHRIEFENTVDWHESHQFLASKVEFNWDIVTDFATYDIQYGVVRRPNHYNTTIDSAKFEVCGHKFADLSESNYGIALINDCKYGYATHGKTQRLSLLRSPKGPDELADMGQHKFKYAIYPHEGSYSNSDVMQAALEFNTPLSIRSAKGKEIKSGTLLPSLFKIKGSKQIIIDTVKLSEGDQ